MKGRGGRRHRLGSPRCDKHALAFCRRYGIQVPAALAAAVTQKGWLPDRVRIQLLEERVAKTEEWLLRLEGRVDAADAGAMRPRRNPR